MIFTSIVNTYFGHISIKMLKINREKIEKNQRFGHKQEMSLKKTNGVKLKKKENITQDRLSACT